MSVVQTTAERINQLRRVVLHHSILYYRFGESVITDAQFDKFAYELVDLQEKYPEESETVPFFLEEFRDFDGSTGFHLPITDPHEVSKSRYILQLHLDRRQQK